MDFLGIVQSLHNEAKLAGSAPAAVAGQTGRAADLVRWAIDAWNDIQSQRDGKWKWLRGNCYFDTVADQASYVSTTEVYDTDDAAFITRFRAWDLDRREAPLIYLSADGKATERELNVSDWSHFRYLYVRGTHTSGYSGSISTDFADKLHLGPTPDAVYRVTGHYWKSNQTLAADIDVPEMPVDYHMAIVYRALLKYGYNTVSQEILTRAQSEGSSLYNELVMNQAYSRFSYSIADALA